VTRHRAAEPTAPTAATAAATTTTRADLRRWRLGLLAGTGVVLACAFTMFFGAHLSVDEDSSRGLPAVVYSLNAARAVASANQAAATNFASSADVALVGTGRDYQAQLDLASQSLEQVAGVNEAGNEGTQDIQSADGQLATYMELVGQADAYYARGEPTVGASELWHAEQIMGSQGGVLDDLDKLRGEEFGAVAAPGGWFWTSPLAVVVWLVPAVALLVALLLAQRYLARRFRRRYNWPLVAASVLVATLALGVVFLVVADARFASARAELAQVVAARNAQTTAVQVQGNQTVVTVVRARCGTDAACGPTISAIRSASVGDPGTAAATTATTAATGDLAAADATYGLLVVIPAVGLVAAVLVAAGFQPRINEYRYEP
jgi:hypothetical protein